MSVNPTTNFMSNEYILSWMEQKTEGIYGKMRTAMDSSDTRAHAEEALNRIKGKIAEAEAKHTDGALLRADIAEVIREYGADFPELQKTLKPMLQDLDERYAASVKAAQQDRSPWQTLNNWSTVVASLSPITISKEDSDRWGKAIDSQVEAFGKADQLGMINIQELNAQLNQAKQTASALMDSADKSANAIISHIG